MRLRVYHAATASEAMTNVRSELGDTAVIVATQELRGGQVRVTAAIESSDDDLSELLAPGLPEPVERALSQAMASNEVPADLAAKLMDEARSAAVDEPVLALSQALTATLPFAAMLDDEKPSIMLIGPPGTGKTAVAAKLAARAVLGHKAPLVVSTDSKRSGGASQLESLLQPLGLHLNVATDNRDLRRLMQHRDIGPVIVDAAAVNPFRTSELAAASAMVEASGAMPIAVLAAGGGVGDSAEAAGNLAAVGARRMIVTRLDVGRRLGGMMAAAAAGLAFCEVSISPLIARGLSPLSPTGLARQLLRQHNTASTAAREKVSA